MNIVDAGPNHRHGWKGRRATSAHPKGGCSSKASMRTAKETKKRPVVVLHYLCICIYYTHIYIVKNTAPPVFSPVKRRGQTTDRDPIKVVLYSYSVVYADVCNTMTSYIKGQSEEDAVFVRHAVLGFVFLFCFFFVFLRKFEWLMLLYCTYHSTPQIPVC